jgi:beta-lactamase superfamily II metal-dependent hydrolase
MADNIFSLEVLRACKGDCLLLHYGTQDDPGLALIDGGHDNVYQPFLRPRLEELRIERGLADDEPLTIDLMMLSHIDEDHVAGLLELTAELCDADDNQQPKIVQVLDLWHNTFDDIIENDADELANGVSLQFGPASLNGDLPADAFADLTDPADARTAADGVMVLASVPQGRQLRLDAEKLKIDRNVDLDGKLVVADAGDQPVDMGKGLTFTVVGPMLPEVKALQQKHMEWLRDTPAGKRAAAEALAAYVDKSVPNLSSIVVLAEVGTKRILFTGDARGDKILEGLEQASVVDAGGSIHVDVLKGPHHGSSNNVEPAFFERITADHYVFSGNGEHGNPERETLEMLAAARGDGDYRIHLTYPVDEIDVARKQDWEIERGKEIKRHAKNPAVEIRAEWSDDVNSLAAFLADHPDVADRILTVEEGVPHMIDLLGQP